MNELQIFNNERLLFRDYLDCIFTSQQQKILALCTKKSFTKQ